MKEAETSLPWTSQNQAQRRREQVLLKFFEDLKAEGYKLRKIQNLKPKHILSRIAAWQEAGKSPGTIKTELSHLRWLCQKLGKAAPPPLASPVVRRSVVPS